MVTTMMMKLMTMTMTMTMRMNRPLHPLQYPKLMSVVIDHYYPVSTCGLDSHCFPDYYHNESLSCYKNSLDRRQERETRTFMVQSVVLGKQDPNRMQTFRRFFLHVVRR